YKILCAIVIFTVFIWLSVAEASPRFVFFFIGDGMGENDFWLVERYYAFQGVSSSFSELSFAGTLGTLSLGAVPDSASSGTALACGVKTRNGMVGVDASGKRVLSLAEIAYNQGLRVGIITNVAINDATPAAFYAHRNSRRDYAEIASDMVESGFDLFVGGGINTPGNASDLTRKKEYKICRSWEEFFQSSLPLIALLPFPFAIDRKEGEYSLRDAVRRGIQLLSDEKGFFLLVEGGKIDWCKHMNDAGSLLFELLDFDEALGEALIFAREHPQKTLIIVTADHETGGMNISREVSYLGIQKQSFSYQVFLDKLLSGNPLEEVIQEMWGWKPKIDQLSKLLFEHSNKNKVFISLAQRFAKENGISWETTGHTGEKVPFLYGERE
ncbi:MAG: alkaline phosphatase, partial [Candidatus Caldatribacteriaceae bacterium]